MDQTTGLWAPNLDCFVSRLASHPERLSNIYFNAVLLLRAINRAAPYLRAYDIGVAPLGRALDEATIAKRIEDKHAKEALEEVLSLAGRRSVDRGFDEGDFFVGDDASLLKDQFKTHFRNVSRIMDCVGCDKCRLWGKLQVSGLGTALKILFELDERTLDPRVNPDLLQRSEVVALFNTLHRVSESLESVDMFRRIYADRQRQALETPAVLEIPSARTQVGMSGWGAGLGVLVSAIEAVRRGCQGCWEVCTRLGASGRMSWVVEWARNGVGAAMKRLEL